MKRLSEHDVQAAIVETSKLVIPRSMGFLAAIPNGAYLSGGDRAAKKLIKEGLYPGIPDLVIPMNDGRICWMEVKVPSNPFTGSKAGTLSREQKDTHERLRDLGHSVYVVHDQWEATEIWRKIGLTNR